MDNNLPDRNQPLVGRSDETFSIMDIPEQLFREISEKLGLGTKYELHLFQGHYFIQMLVQNSPFTGFEGAIGYRNENNFRKFVLWDRIPKEEHIGTISEPDPILEILVRSKSAGVWAYGRGNLMRETANASCKDLDLNSPASVLAALIIARASKLVRDPTCVKQACWDKAEEPY